MADNIVDDVIENVLSVSNPALLAAAVGVGVAIENARVKYGEDNLPEALQEFLADAADAGEKFISGLFDGLGIK